MCTSCDSSTCKPVGGLSSVHSDSIRHSDQVRPVAVQLGDDDAQTGLVKAVTHPRAARPPLSAARLSGVVGHTHALCAEGARQPRVQHSVAHERLVVVNPVGRPHLAEVLVLAGLVAIETEGVVVGADAHTARGADAQLEAALLASPENPENREKQTKSSSSS